MSTFFIARISTGSLFSKQLILKKRVSLGSPGNNRSKDLSENILAGTLFLTVISEGT
jgi:hypothetical protein